MTTHEIPFFCDPDGGDFSKATTALRGRWWHGSLAAPQDLNLYVPLHPSIRELLVPSDPFVGIQVADKAEARRGLQRRRA
jgi:hypothetical protein